MFQQSLGNVRSSLCDYEDLGVLEVQYVGSTMLGYFFSIRLLTIPQESEAKGKGFFFWFVYYRAEDLQILS